MSDSAPLGNCGDYDDYQIPLPPSFQALYVDKRGRLLAPLEQVRGRYEWCEDLANLLVESVSSQPQENWREQQKVLQQCQEGLTAGPVASGQSPAEAGWIVQRLAELLGWAAPESEDASG